MTIKKAQQPNNEWLIACYLQDGTHHGWYTARGTLSYYSGKAQRFTSKQAADNRLVRLELEWPTVYIWLAEEAPTVDIDARTGEPPLDDPTTTGSDNSSDMATIGRVYADSVPPVSDKRQTHVVKSAARTGPTREATRRDEASTGKQGEPMTVKKKPTNDAADEPKPKVASLAAKGKPAVKGKPTLRTAARKQPASKTKAAGKSNGATTHPCLCGCGNKTKNYFLRGHIKRFRMHLRAIKAGVSTPEKLFGKKLAEAMGPWKKNKAGGLIPAVNSYANIQAAL